MKNHDFSLWEVCLIQLAFSEDLAFNEGGAGRCAKISPSGWRVPVLPFHMVSSDGTGDLLWGLPDMPSRTAAAGQCRVHLRLGGGGGRHPALCHSAVGLPDGWVVLQTLPLCVSTWWPSLSPDRPRLALRMTPVPLSSVPMLDQITRLNEGSLDLQVLCVYCVYSGIHMC